MSFFEINHRALVISLVIGCLTIVAFISSRSSASVSLPIVNAAQNVVEKPLSDAKIPKDVTDKGHSQYPRFLADVNNDGINDYCRAVGDAPKVFLSCQLGGRDSFSRNPYGFNSEAGKTDFGYGGTAWMEDVNGDGRMDYCRQVGTDPNRFYAALLAGPNGFSKQQYTRIKRVEGDPGWIVQ